MTDPEAAIIGAGSAPTAAAVAPPVRDAPDVGPLPGNHWVRTLSRPAARITAHHFMYHFRSMMAMRPVIPASKTARALLRRLRP